jgi:hypothetical protein
MTSRARRFGLIGLALAAFTTRALAQDCAEWLPDLSCDRAGRFAGFEKPIVQPYLFEDPFITTGFYPYYVWHQFPKDSAMEGGEAHVAAAQIRLALTDRLALIATKDGYMWKRPDNPLLPETEGWMNLAAGLKYALYQDRDAGRIVSAVLRYEAPTGAHDTLQGEGDGAILPSITGAVRLGDIALQGDFGAAIGLGSSQSSALFYHVYLAYPLLPRFSPFIQFSGMHWVESGDGSLEVPLSKAGQQALGVSSVAVSAVEGIYGRFEGADVLNLGATRADGLDYVTFGIGAHVRASDHVTISLGWEGPMSKRELITEQRVTTSVALEF